MKKLNDNGKGFLVFLLKVAVGILILVDHVRFTATIISIFGVLIAIFGVIEGIRYFMTPPDDAEKEKSLSKGLICIGIGTFCFLRSGWLVDQFSVLTLLYGVGMIFTGIMELEWTVDMLRLKKGGWIPQAISSLFALIVGTILVLNPFESTEILWNFAGIAIIVSALPDLIVPFTKVKEAPTSAESDTKEDT